MDSNNKDSKTQERRPACSSPTPQARSPSPSTLSTASSASPLIRSNSSFSNSAISSPSTTANLTSGSSSSNRASGSSLHHQALKRPAPTSIAAAQLRQQQQMVGANMSTTAGGCKLQNGNKLAHMTWAQQQVALSSQLEADYRLAVKQQAKAEKKKKSAIKDEKSCDAADQEVGGHPNKSFGYNCGKFIAFKASRLNEFWSINKMRYMNLACLLMTIVCLITILMFSKTGNQPNASNQLEERQTKKLANNNQAFNSPTNRRRLDGGRQTADNSQLESLDSIDRQAFMGLNKRHSLFSKGEPITSPLASTQTPTNSLDDSSSEVVKTNVLQPSASGSFDELLQDAREQLKRQQEGERESEESTSKADGGSEQNIDLQQQQKQQKRPTTPSIVDPILGQVFDDLDNFGLFKAIKSQLFNQRTNFTQSKPLVRKTKNGATIIMTFGGSSLDSSNSSQSNETSSAKLPSLLDKLLPPLFRSSSSLNDLQTSRSSPSGFASITIDSEPLIRGPIFSASSSSSPFGLFSNPPMIPQSQLVNPNFSPLISLARPPAFSPNSSPIPAGLLNMIMRISSDLAEQLQQQDSGNKTDTNQNSNSTNVGQDHSMEQQATSQRASISRLSPINSNSSSSSNLDDEVETFDVSQLSASPFFRPPIPMRSIYSSSKSRPSSMIMISSSSSSAPISSSIFNGANGFESDSGPFSMGSLSRPFALSPFPSVGDLNGPESSPSIAMPRMLMFGGSGSNGNPSNFMNYQRHPMSPIMRSILNNIAPSVSKAFEHDKDGSISPPASRRDDNQELLQEQTDDIDETPFGPRGLGRVWSRSRALNDDDSGPTADQIPFLGNVGGSLIEQMLESTNGAAPIGRVSGTIKQIIRGPGLMVERTIKLPQQVRQYREQQPAIEEQSIHSVGHGIKSQSISRMDSTAASAPGSDIDFNPMIDNQSHKMSSSQQAPSFAKLFPERDSDSSQDFMRSNANFPIMQVPSLQVGGLFRRLFNDMNSRRQDLQHDSLASDPLESSSSLFRGPILSPHLNNQHKSHRQQRTFERSMEDDDDDEGPTNPNDGPQASSQDGEPDAEETQERPIANHQQHWSPKVRVATARIKLNSRADSDQATHLLPSKLRFVPTEQLTRREMGQVDDQLVRRQQDDGRALKESHEREMSMKLASPFTSPDSPLFGFPALKPIQLQAEQTAAARSTVAEHPASRPFVYHSNHEVAGSMGRSSEPRSGDNQAHMTRSNYQQRSATGQSLSGLPAAIGMGRRLDEGELHMSN